jgi:hypothetical protein
VSEGGYKLDPSTVAPILRMKETPPKTVNEVRKLMGFLNYYRRYTETFSRLIITNNQEKIIILLTMF